MLALADCILYIYLRSRVHCWSPSTPTHSTHPTGLFAPSRFHIYLQRHIYATTTMCHRPRRRFICKEWPKYKDSGCKQYTWIEPLSDNPVFGTVFCATYDRDGTCSVGGPLGAKPHFEDIKDHRICSPCYRASAL